VAPAIAAAAPAVVAPAPLAVAEAPVAPGGRPQSTKQVFVDALCFLVDTEAFERAHGRFALQAASRPRLLDKKAADELRERVAATPSCTTIAAPKMLVLEDQDASVFLGGIGFEADREAPTKGSWELKVTATPRVGPDGTVRLDAGVGVTLSKDAEVSTTDDVVLQGQRFRFDARPGTTALLTGGSPDPRRPGLVVWALVEASVLGEGELLIERWDEAPGPPGIAPVAAPAGGPGVAPVPPPPPPAPVAPSPVDDRRGGCGGAGACG
jgi:hypothetical protein